MQSYRSEIVDSVRCSIDSFQQMVKTLLGKRACLIRHSFPLFSVCSQEFCLWVFGLVWFWSGVFCCSGFSFFLNWTSQSI